MNLLWVEFGESSGACSGHLILVLDRLVNLAKQESQKPSWLLASDADSHRARNIINTFTGILNVRVPIVVARLRDEVAVHLTDLVRQLRLFLRVVVFIVGAHRAPVEYVLHRLRLGLSLGAKSG